MDKTKRKAHGVCMTNENQICPKTMQEAIEQKTKAHVNDAEAKQL